MGRPTSPRKHVVALRRGQFSEELLYPNSSPILTAIIQSANKCTLPHEQIGFIASYPFGHRIAEFLANTTGNIRFTPVCHQKAGLCAECREMLTVCADGYPLIIALRNNIEIYLDTSAYATTSGQASSVPIQICSPGQALGFLESLTDTFSLRSNARDSLSLATQPLHARAGARSIFVGAPLADEDLVLKLLSLPSASSWHDTLNLDFDSDPWSFIRLLAHVTDASTEFQHQWRVEVLVVPRAVLQSLLNEDHALEVEMLKLALVESSARLRSALTAKHLTEVAYSAASTLEARPHLNEVLQIAANHRLGFGPASDDSLGPFSAIQKFIAASGLMKTRTLKNRIPAIIIPKTFTLSRRKADFVYYSLRRPTTQTMSPPPTRPSRVIIAVAQAMSRLKKTKINVGLFLTFFASEKQPKAVVPIHPVAANHLLNQDFAEQLKLGESKFGLDKSTALGDPRSGFLGHFVRISNQLAYRATEPHSARRSLGA